MYEHRNERRHENESRTSSSSSSSAFLSNDLVTRVGCGVKERKKAKQGLLVEPLNFFALFSSQFPL